MGWAGLGLGLVEVSQSSKMEGEGAEVVAADLDLCSSTDSIVLAQRVWLWMDRLAGDSRDSRGRIGKGSGGGRKIKTSRKKRDPQDSCCVFNGNRGPILAVLEKQSPSLPRVCKRAGRVLSPHWICAAAQGPGGAHCNRFFFCWGSPSASGPGYAGRGSLGEGGGGSKVCPQAQSWGLGGAAGCPVFRISTCLQGT